MRFEKRLSRLLLIGAVTGIFALIYVQSNALKTPINVSLHELADPLFIPSEPTKTFGCVSYDGYPDFSCTPGAIFTHATIKEICTSGYARSKRSVTSGMKRDIKAAYGIGGALSAEYHIDHLISLQLGGSNDPANLWPLAVEGDRGKKQKDIVENFLHDKLCAGDITLKETQSLISHRWADVYTLLPR
ncbi:hypothetical protein HY627_00325 [Candidatus Uhrbacteria bacterium]|nr:hypothetical protein [Candidatus Uhrbacteria bacterium]